MAEVQRFGVASVNPDAAQALRRVLRRRIVCLASGSPRRREILTACGVDFRVASHGLDEPLPTGPDWRRWVRTWALRKAQAAGAARGLVIGSDTIVVSRGRGLGKPVDADAARVMLRRLSGRRHFVFTGVAAIDMARQRTATGSACTVVVFRQLGEDEIRDYVRTGEPMDKAGAYGIQGRAGRFVAGVTGPVDNVIGLPVACLTAVIRRVLS